MFNCVCNGRLHIKGNNSRKAGAATAVNGLRLKKMGVNSGSKLRYHVVGRHALAMKFRCENGRKQTAAPRGYGVLIEARSAVD